jgi:nucleoside-diphosphate-sugar epimerase
MSLPPSNGKTLLVTGINGYIASSLGEMILQKGYNLRGTSRSLASTDPLIKGAYAPYASRVEILEVPDMTVPGAFDKAVHGVHGIFHTASPISFDLQTYEQVITPAVAGTETLLNSALAHAGPQLTSIVVTSSAATVIDPKPAGSDYIFTEAYFASHALTVAETNKAANTPTPPEVLYRASKQAAERTVWEFRKAHSPPFALTTIHPTVTIGPPVALPSSPDKLNITLQPTYSIFTGGAIPPSIGSGSFVDVRDVAFCHFWAYEHPKEADGERFIASQGFGPPQALADVLREAYPDRRGIIQVGKPGEGYVGYNAETGVVEGVEYPAGGIRVSGAKAEKVMGLKYRGFKESLLETTKVMEKYL